MNIKIKFLLMLDPTKFYPNLTSLDMDPPDMFKHVYRILSLKLTTSL